MRFFLLRRDDLIERGPDQYGPFEVLRIDGRWTPIPDSFEDHLQREHLTEPDAQAHAKRLTGADVDLHAPLMAGSSG